ncbi:MAG: proteasome accessory factor PafA2 family protein [Deltaproteobacteria bacterium]|nr:proteasome accessory factor PafA2 family protein [Deltaproteobacteria bacterium]
MSEAARILGVETEYAVVGGGDDMEHLAIVEGLMRHARRRLAHLPDELGRGIFLASGGRFYLDCGAHPEMTTPECGDPWSLVGEVRAGERTMLELAGEWSTRLRGGRVLVLRTNVDLSGSQATWGTHENYGHRAATNLAPAIVPHLVSRVVFTGAGGFDNLSHGIDFTLSPRTPHLVQEVSDDSTGRRGIFHDKQEHLARTHRRLHLLCGESLCSDLALWLRTGTTALVVALAEGGVQPGAAVTLRNPVAAMRYFARDPTCRATAPAAHGGSLTALDVQRHYLALAEAHAGAPFMPPWTEAVCRAWRNVLDRLAHGPDAVATRLDWAVKLALFRAHARRRGVAWETLAAWSPIVAQLGTALARADRREPLTSRLVLGPESPIAAEVARLGPIVTGMGLSWKEIEAVLALRLELFELDARFGQLGEGGIFAQLDTAGTLDHRVEPAPGAPPIPRAALRAALVRELAGNGTRYSCTWSGIWDSDTDRYVDLDDPFEVRNEWIGWRPNGPGVPPERFLRGRERRAADPIALSIRALELRKRHQLPQAERALRRAIALEDEQVPADSPKRPHRRNNLALVLLRAEKLDEARAANAEAWRLKTPPHDVTSGRILFTRVALLLLAGERAVRLHLGQLKTLLAPGTLACLGDVTTIWDVPDVLAFLAERLASDEAALLAAIAETLNAPAEVAALDAHARWAAADATPLTAPWPSP